MADMVAISAAQDEVRRAFTAAVDKLGARNPEVENLRSDHDYWRRADPGGKEGWAIAGTTPDGKPYPLSLWLAEGRALAQRGAALAGGNFTVNTAPLIPTDTAATLNLRRTVQWATLGAAVLALGTTIAIAVWKPRR